MADARIVVVGASAGGMEALTKLVEQLPPDFPAAVFVVQHMAADNSGNALLGALKRAARIPCGVAGHGQRFKAGHLYVGPPDHHMLIGENEKILITKGARENRSRPGIDPLFRSAAVAASNRVVGVLLTGHLDDGTAGLHAIDCCGGTTIVQDPEDAAYPDMPLNAIHNTKVHYVVGLAQMGALLTQIVSQPLGKDVSPPEEVIIESRIAERVLSDLESVEALGTQVPFNCPGCGGVLWQIAEEEMRFRCHTGHAFTAPVLLAEQTAKIEETMWIALRMFEERRNLLMTMAAAGGRGPGRSAAERAQESLVHIQRIRSMLTSDDKATDIGGGNLQKQKTMKATPSQRR